MKKVVKFFTILLALVITTAINTEASAQSSSGGTVSATGTVFDEVGEPLIGATVMELGTQNGVMTDVDGQFQINTKRNATLRISYVGFAPQEVAAGTGLKVTLKSVSNTLEDVVVIGYGTARKKDMTGAVTQVKADLLASENPNTVQDLLRGVAGLNVGITNNAKGGGSLRIRGDNSLGAGNDPLTIVDGMIFYGEMSEINPDDIQQIDVLKDASAAAVYGAQAANGVIIITTKKGKTGKPTVNLTANFGFTERAGYQEYYSPEEYINHKQVYFEAGTYGFDADGNYTTYQSSYKDTPGYFSNPNNLPAGVSLDQWRGYTTQEGQSDYEIWLRRLNFKGDLLANALSGTVTDWDDYVYQTGFQQDYNISVSGGTEKANYYMSAGYLHNDGIVIDDYYQSIRATMKADMEVADWLKIGGSVRFQDRSDDARPVSTGLVGNSPFGHAYDEDGTPSRFVLGPQSDYSLMGDANLYDRQWDTKEQGYTTFDTKFFATVNLPFGITYTLNFAPRYQFYYKREWIDSSKPDRKPEDSGANRDMAKRFDWSLNNVLTWNRKFADKHNVTLTFVQEAEERRYWSEGVGARAITPTDALGFHFIESASGNLYSSFWSTDTHTTADGMLARGQYNFDDRYLFTASIRRDGYSAFGRNNPHAYFPAFAAGWVFSNESFWSNFADVMNYGKLRVSYGKNGNRSIGDYVALANLVTGGGNRVMYYVGDNINPELLSYLRVDRLANPNLQWEKTASLNIGIDFGFLNNRISGSLDTYFQRTTNMIMGQRLPGFSGYSSITTNLGEVANDGIELSLNTLNIDNPNFTWTTDLTFTYNKNHIKHLLGDYDENGKEMDVSSNGWFIGHSINEIWDYKVEGIWQVNEAEEAAKYGQRPGDIKVWNNPDNDIVNEDGSITYVYNNDDKVFLGQRTAPYRLTMRNNFTIFKNIDISLSMYGMFGHKDCQGGIYDGDIIANNDNGGGFLLYGMKNQQSKDIWTPWNPIDDAGRIEAKGPTGATSPRLWVNRSFLRFSNLSVSYHLPKKVLNAIKANDVKFFFNVNNLGTIHGSAWKEAYGDPENHSYTTRTYTLGFNIKY